MMRAPRPWSVAVLGAVAAGCTGGDFIGDDNRIYFRSNLSRPYIGWGPRVPVAVGAQVSLTAVDQQPNDAGRPMPPGAMPRVDDAGVFAVADAGIDWIVGAITTPGATRLDWNGTTASDHFTLRAQTAASATVEDPILARIVQPSSLPIPRDAGWPDVGSEFWLATGGALYLDGVLHGADGGRLAHAPLQLEAHTQDPLGVYSQDFGVVISANGEGGQTADVVLQTGGADLGAVRVHTAPVSEVVTVTVQQAVLQPGLAVFKATAFLDGGQPLWQAHVRWAFDPHFTELDLSANSPVPKRQDILVLSWTPGDAGTIRAPIYTGVGGLEVTTELEIAVDGTPVIAEAELPVARPRPCHCGAAPGLSSLALLLLLARLGRRRAALRAHFS